MSKLRKISGAVLAASLIPVGAHAQEGSDNRTVVTPSRRGGPVFESASQTHVVTQEQIDFEMPQDVPEMLLSTPGVLVQRTNRGAPTPGLRGFTRANLFRMRQFYETYRSSEKVAPLVRQLPWTHHLIILGRTKYPEQREFYMLSDIQGRWTKRELERQIRSGAALRSGPSGKKA